MNQNRPGGSTATLTRPGGASATPALVMAAESRRWQRRVGPLAWTTLQDLALSSHRSDQGWVVAVGVRDIAADLGVTKDTAARAVSILIDAGLVSRGRVSTPEGRRRSGYLLQLPAPIRLIAGPYLPSGDRGGRS